MAALADVSRRVELGVDLPIYVPVRTDGAGSRPVDRRSHANFSVRQTGHGVSRARRPAYLRT